MSTRFLFPLLSTFLLLTGSLAQAKDSRDTAEAPSTTEKVATVLADYVAKPDSSYRWEKVRQGDVDGVQYSELILTSQTWRDIVWKHRLFVMKPDQLKAEQHALLLVAGGSWNDKYSDPSADSKPGKQALLFANIARQLKTPVAVLLQVPHQPIFNGLKEDAIISYTFEEFLNTGDPEWPLLLPMVKSAVRGMDAVQEFCQQEWALSVESFTVTGASKRGWTTWLTGASDPRVTAIAPMVIDMLNMRDQLDHQLEMWGKFSPQIRDYTKRKLPQRMKTDEGNSLVQIVDPLAYRDALTLPKLIVLGTNDAFWTLDALNLYWSKLVGPKYILYVPNNGHGLKDLPRVLGGVLALHEEAQGGARLPQFTWDFEQSDGHATLTIHCSTSPKECQFWTAESAAHDFRKAVWTATPSAGTDGSYSFEMEVPQSGSQAIFGEVIFQRPHFPLHLSTNVYIVE